MMEEKPYNKESIIQRDPLQINKGTTEPSLDALVSEEEQDPEHEFFRRERFPFTACAACLLVLANCFIFVLMIILGGILGFMEGTGEEYDCGIDLSTRARKCNYRSKDPNKTDRNLVVLILAGQTFGTLITLYCVCKPSKEGRKLLRAGMAVFCCCRQQRRYYEEAVVPYSTLFDEFCAGLRSCICDITLSSLKLCLAPACFVGFLFLLFSGVFVLLESLDWSAGENTLLITLCIIAGVIWCLVWKFILSKENSFSPPVDGSTNDDEVYSQERTSPDSSGMIEMA